jgi:hypothetical protein
MGCAARKRREDFFSLSFDLNHNRFAEHLQHYPLPIVGDLMAEVFPSTSATAPCALYESPGSANAENATSCFHFV